MKRLRRSIWIFSFLLIILIVSYIFPLSYKIDTTIHGVQCRIGDNNYSEDVMITIKGVYYQYLFKKNTFYGSISIDSYDFTVNAPIVPAYFSDNHANLIYTYTQNGITGMHSFGTFSCTPTFDKLLICIDEPLEANAKSWNDNNGLFICAPAKTRAQAVDIAKTLSSKSQWLSNIKWN